MIIPTLFALDKETFESKLKLCSPLSQILHIDFCDGKFVSTKTISFDNMISVSNYENSFQVHLMAFNPHIYIQKLKKLNINTVLIQYEAFENKESLFKSIEKFKASGFSLGLVVNPDTKIGDFISVISHFEIVMFMSVYPGREGQDFIIDTYTRVRQLRALNKSIIIQVDGGVNIENISQLKRNGVDRFCVGSYISSSKTPQKNFNLLNNLIKTS